MHPRPSNASIERWFHGRLACAHDGSQPSAFLAELLTVVHASRFRVLHHEEHGLQKIDLHDALAEALDGAVELTNGHRARVAWSRPRGRAQ